MVRDILAYDCLMVRPYYLQIVHQPANLQKMVQIGEDILVPFPWKSLHFVKQEIE